MDMQRPGRPSGAPTCRAIGGIVYREQPKMFKSGELHYFRRSALVDFRFRVGEMAPPGHFTVGGRVNDSSYSTAFDLDKYRVNPSISFLTLMSVEALQLLKRRKSTYLRALAISPW